MGITLRWGNKDHTIISYHIEAPWSWEEADHARLELDAMILSVNHRVDFIFDVGKIGSIPKNTLQIVYDRFVSVPRNAGVFAVVGAPMMVKAMLDVLRLLRPEVFSRYYTVGSLDDAQRLIQRHTQRVH